MGKIRFKTLAERLEDVDVNVTRHLEFVPDEGDGEPTSTHFVDLAKSWSQRNRTEDFVNCLHELRPHTQSLPMIICNLGTIVDILLAHVAKPKTMAAEPILMLLGVLAKDACMELLPHFTRIFTVLVQLIAAVGKVGEQDADMLEHVFQCLAYLLKYLARYVVADLSKYLAQYAVLLKHGKPHIRHFAGETLAFILRRVKLSGMEAAYEEIFKLAENLPEEELLHMADGLSVLLMESVRGAQRQFRSQTPDILETIFQGQAQRHVRGAPRAAQLAAVRAAVLRMRSFAGSLDNAAPVVEAFFRHFAISARRYAKVSIAFGSNSVTPSSFVFAMALETLVPQKPSESRVRPAAPGRRQRFNGSACTVEEVEITNCPTMPECESESEGKEKLETFSKAPTLTGLVAGRDKLKQARSKHHGPALWWSSQEQRLERTAQALDKELAGSKLSNLSLEFKLFE